MHGIAQLNVENFSHALAAGSAQVVVFFSAAWCQPCQSMQPVFSQLASRYAGVGFGIVDVAQSPTLAPTYGIRSVPALAMFRHGVLADVVSGPASVETWTERMQQAFSPQ